MTASDDGDELCFTEKDMSVNCSIAHQRGLTEGVDKVVALLRKERDAWGSVDVDDIVERWECGELFEVEP